MWIPYRYEFAKIYESIAFGSILLKILMKMTNFVFPATILTNFSIWMRISRVGHMRSAQAFSKRGNSGKKIWK